MTTWADSGLLDLTGWPGGPPLAPTADVAGRLDRLVADIEAASGVRLDWGHLLAGRAAMLGLARQGRTSPNGTCRLLRTRDGWAAVSLARPADVESVPALIEGPVDGDPWEAVAAWAARSATHQVVDRARLLGLAAAGLGEAVEMPPAQVTGRWQPGPPLATSMLRRRVIDLSSLWAGPLAARILAEAGAEVVKVESTDRPDGARQTPAFYDWLHPPDQQVETVDIATAAGRRRLFDLVDGADIVIEASRARALRHVGADPEAVDDRPGRIWLSITGYGRSQDWVAFGDDAAVAGGLVAWDEAGTPVFCGDALADPLTGLWGAREVLRSAAAGGGDLVSIAMAGVAATMAAP